MIKNVLTKFASVSFLTGMFFVSATFAQQPPAPAAGTAPAGGTAEVERVVVTGSNIPTAEETGPNPVDTYRPAGHRETGHPQRNRPDYLYPAGSWRQCESEHG